MEFLSVSILIVTTYRSSIQRRFIAIVAVITAVVIATTSRMITSIVTPKMMSIAAVGTELTTQTLTQFRDGFFAVHTRRGAQQKDRQTGKEEGGKDKGLHGETETKKD